MLKKKISGFIIAISVTYIISTPVMVYADEIKERTESSSRYKPRAGVYGDASLGHGQAMQYIYNEDDNELYSCIKVKYGEDKLSEANETMEVLSAVNEVKFILDNVKKLNKNIYTSDSWNLLMGWVNEAETMVSENERDNDELKKVIEKLSSCIEGLEIRSEKAELQELMDYAESINDIGFAHTDNHIEAKWDNFLYFRKIVREVLENLNSSDSEIRSAKWQLEYVINELE